VIHAADAHRGDGEDHAPKIAQVLRFAAALPWPGKRAGNRPAPAGATTIT